MSDSLSLSDPHSRAVLEDSLLQQGRSLRWVAWTGLYAVAVAPAAADAAADAVAPAAADAVDADADADAASPGAAADADGVAADAADAAADAADAADAARQTITRRIKEEPDMRDGLKIVVTPGSYWALTQIGWLRRLDGDEYELVGARTLRRVGAQVPLAQLAAEGPGDSIKVQPTAVEPEEIHRLLIRRSIPASESAWAKWCPKPAGWGDAP
jgi:hypothetical protein